ncbi:ABC transporter family protein [Kineococcus xinjiangensis]|uniref:ABC transporter family protein n=1 Tax=Kineococcus xinjiangensis TaxID=512762 RepID=A0A2S6IMB2_9ACTN|nr:ABC transporter ATP-binding protein [Kineococcus xinjiangensis]PPK95349.1 ABC transporter family protein [Kineococcus xinjiangensis]
MHRPAPAVVSVTDLVVGHGTPLGPPLSFDLAAGEVLAVVGANGSGKSTLLRTVAGLLPPLAGQVRVLGAPLDARSRSFRAAVATDLGDDAFLPGLTVREHLLLVASGHAVPDPVAVCERLLAEFGLTDRADAPPTAVSSGQRRRLLMAAAFARPRALLLLDEPEQRLDPGMRRAVTARLRAERDGGGAVLVATHDGDLVRGCATSALVLAEDDVRSCAPEQAAAAIEAL